MKISKILPGIFSIILTSPVAHASESFRIEDYKPIRLVDFQWKIEPGLSSDNSEIGSEAGSTAQFTPGRDVFDQSQSKFRLINTLDYYDYSLKRTWNVVLTVTPEYERTNSLTENQREDFDRRETSSRFNRDRQIRADLLLSGDWYARENVFFTSRLEFAGSLSDKKRVNSNSSVQFVPNGRRTTSSESLSETDGEWFRIRGQAGIGVGRTYDGRFGYLALEALRELRDNLLLSRELTKSEFRILAEKMYQSLEIHNVDSRIRRIETITDMTNWLYDIGALKEASPLATLSLLDVWEYSPQDRRMFGFQARIVFGAEVNESEFKRNSNTVRLDSRTRTFTMPDTTVVTTSEGRSGNDETDFSRSVRPFVTTEILYEKPINHRLQFSFLASFQYNLDYDRFSDFRDASIDGSSRKSTTTNMNKGNWDLNTNFKLSKIFSSRTRVDILAQLSWQDIDFHSSFSSLNIDSGMVPYRNQSESFSSSYTRTADLSLAMEYRIAIPTTITAEIGMTGVVSKSNSVQRRSSGDVLFGVGIRSYLY